MYTLPGGHRLSVASQNVLVELQMFGKVTQLTQRLCGACHHSAVSCQCSTLSCFLIFPLEVRGGADVLVAVDTQGNCI